MTKLTANKWRRVPVRIAVELTDKEVDITDVQPDKEGWWIIRAQVNGWPHTYHVCAQDEFEALLTLSKMRSKDAYEEEGFFEKIREVR